MVCKNLIRMFLLMFLFFLGETHSCDIPEPQKHGDWFCPSSYKLILDQSTNYWGYVSTEAVTCHLECHPGYVSTNATVITCQQGEWSEDPSCITAIALITGSSYSALSVEIYGKGLHKKLPDLPDYRTYHSLQVVDSSILLCGGASAYSKTSCLVLTASQQFTSHSNTTIPRCYHSSASMLGQLHLLGGWAYPKNRKLVTTEYLHPPSLQWTASWNVIEDTSSACAAKIGPENLIVTGGLNNERSVVMYNVTNGHSTRLQNLLSRRYSHGCAYVMDTGTDFKGVLTAGGRSFGGWGIDSRSSEIYDLTTGEWSIVGKLTHGSIYGGVRMIVLGEDILTMGGWSDLNDLSTVERFNWTTKSWMPTENMIDTRIGHAVTAVPPSAVGIVWSK